MPWLDTFRSDFVMAFEGFWNGWASFRTDILLIICGSATSWVINKVLHNKAGLHNRVSARIRLQPFTLNECEQYVAERGLGMDRFQIMECYMAFDVVSSNAEATLKEAFDYLAANDRRVVIAIDEFQQVAKFPESGTEALLRSYIQFVPHVRQIPE